MVFYFFDSSIRGRDTVVFLFLKVCVRSSLPDRYVPAVRDGAGNELLTSGTGANILQAYFNRLGFQMNGSTQTLDIFNKNTDDFGDLFY